MASVQHHKDPLSWYYGTNGLSLLFLALFAGHIVDQKKRKLISQMHFGFSVISFGLFFIDMAGGRAGLLATNDFILSTTLVFLRLVGLS
jgi:hypothetical protein